MRLFKFAKWWWDKNDPFNRTIVCTGLFWLLPCAISAFWIGKLALAIGMGGVGVILAGWALYGIGHVLKGMWDKFNDELPPEDIALMRKLKGIPTPSRPDPVYYD